MEKGNQQKGDEKMNRVCKHWKELDNEAGQEFEYCKLEKRSCACCGSEKQCSYVYAKETKS
jgi:hypothetical protein